MQVALSEPEQHPKARYTLPKWLSSCFGGSCPAESKQIAAPPAKSKGNFLTNLWKTLRPSGKKNAVKPNPDQYSHSTESLPSKSIESLPGHLPNQNPHEFSESERFASIDDHGEIQPASDDEFENHDFHNHYDYNRQRKVQYSNDEPIRERFDEHGQPSHDGLTDKGLEHEHGMHSGFPHHLSEHNTFEEQRDEQKAKVAAVETLESQGVHLSPELEDKVEHVVAEAVEHGEESGDSDREIASHARKAAIDVVESSGQDVPTGVERQLGHKLQDSISDEHDHVHRREFRNEHEHEHDHQHQQYEFQHQYDNESDHYSETPYRSEQYSEAYSEIPYGSEHSSEPYFEIKNRSEPDPQPKYHNESSDRSPTSL